jgi:enterochelin esterase-like enzyme
MPDAAQSAISVETIEDLHSAHLGNRRRIKVFLPGDYSTSLEARYPVLYANDGQYLPPVLMGEVLSRLYASGQMKKIILVAVEVNSPVDRLSEYGVAGFPSTFGGGLKAQDYTAFIISELLPYINAHYRTLQGPGDTGIMGWSLGGLSAFDIAWGHPDVFGVVGVFSGSFWWRSQGDALQTAPQERIMQSIVCESDKRSGLRMWFMAGTEEENIDSDGNGVIDMIQHTLELMDELALKGYQPGVDMVYFQLEGGQHLPAVWHKTLPEFLKWAFSPGAVEY